MTDLVEEVKEVFEKDYTKYNVYVLDYNRGQALVFSINIPDNIDDINQYIEQELKFRDYNLDEVSYMIIEDYKDDNKAFCIRTKLDVNTNKYRDIKCLFGMHKYEEYKILDKCNAKREIIGKVIIMKCKFCGKIKVINVEL